MLACNFPGARRIGAPKNWQADLDGEVGTIFVTDAVDTLSGMNFMYSIYKPTTEEIAAVINGGVLRLGIMGHSHPVFQLGFLGPSVAEKCELVPMWDLGGVIE